MRIVQSYLFLLFGVLLACNSELSKLLVEKSEEELFEELIVREYQKSFTDFDSAKLFHINHLDKFGDINANKYWFVHDSIKFIRHRPGTHHGIPLLMLLEPDSITFMGLYTYEINDFLLFEKDTVSINMSQLNLLNKYNLSKGVTNDLIMNLTTMSDRFNTNSSRYKFRPSDDYFLNKKDLFEIKDNDDLKGFMEKVNSNSIYFECENYKTYYEDDYIENKEVYYKESCDSVQKSMNEDFEYLKPKIDFFKESNVEEQLAKALSSKNITIYYTVPYLDCYYLYEIDNDYFLSRPQLSVVN